jgi:hypothetical protein
MKTTKKIALSFALVGALTTTQAQNDHHHVAGETHEHKAPHGGVVKTADKQHIEMVKGMDKSGNPTFTFYLLDSEEKTLPNKGKTGVVFYQMADGMSEQVDLILNGDDKYIFTGKKDGNYINLIVSIKEGDKTASAKFEIKAMDAPKKEEHHNDGHSGHSH